jgi:hypothetical protein
MNDKKPPALTQEQLERMEWNRKRALELRAQQERKKQHVAPTIPAAVAPTVTPSSYPANPNARPANLYAAISSPPKNTPASPLAHNTHTQVLPCTRCGDHTGRGLCIIVWSHLGDLQRERGFFR